MKVRNESVFATIAKLFLFLKRKDFYLQTKVKLFPKRKIFFLNENVLADKLDFLTIFLLLADVSPTYSSGLPQGNQENVLFRKYLRNDECFRN